MSGIKKPPIEPEIVFPGLILGASFGPPINLPTKNDDISVVIE